jgi:hypothetical protein
MDVKHKSTNNNKGHIGAKIDFLSNPFLRNNNKPKISDDKK